jgi:hypothetical protein
MARFVQARGHLLRHCAGIIGVGRGSASPSLRTGLAGLPHPALRSVVLPSRGPANRIMSVRQAEQPLFGKEGNGYHGCSDSCARTGVWLIQPGTLPLPSVTQVSPVHVHHLPGSPSPITPPLPTIALAPVLSASWTSRLSRVWASPLHPPPSRGQAQARQSARPYRVRHPPPPQGHAYGLPVRLALLSTPPRGDAVTVGYRTETGVPQGDLHLSDVARLWTHGGPDEPGHDDSATVNLFAG